MGLPATAWVALAAVISFPQAGALPSAAQFLEQNCSAYGVHEGLVQEILRPWKGGLSLRKMLDTQPPEFFSRGRPHVRPVIGIGGANVSLHRSYNGSLDMWLPKEEYIPMLEHLTQHFRLPETFLLLWHWDGPPSPLETNGNAWVDYCSIRGERPAIMLPVKHRPLLFDVKGKSRAGKKDKREGKAVFMGSATGWHKGHRHALARLRLSHPEQVHAGLTYAAGCGQCEHVNQTELPSLVVEAMTLQEQVKKFKYIVQADGNCAALRLRDLLASDSAVMMISSNECEWFYPLLQPYKHYIPVSANIMLNSSEDASPLNLPEQVQWAEANPKVVASIVQEARAFADLHLSGLGQMCYVARLLDAYSQLLSHDVDKPDMIPLPPQQET